MSDNDNRLSRRNFLKLSGTAAAAASAVTIPTAVTAAMVGSGTKARLPKAQGPRLVVVGGGTSGLTIAKYAKKAYPKFDVVLVEKRDMYSSCFASNLWYGGLIDLEFLAGHSFLDAAVNNKYLFFNATCTGLDRAARKLVTDQGEIDYDYLVVAPGIGYDYSRIGVNDPETEYALRLNCPGGFISPTEHVAIRHKVQEFEGGTFVITVPGGNYRCLPGPYERACMIAAAFRKSKVKAKIVVLDHNPTFTVKARGFAAAFADLYKDIIEYRSGSEIKGVDFARREINTEFDSVKFAEALIYPGVRGSPLIETLGLVDPQSRQKEALIDVLKYNVPGDERVYVTGDSRPQPFSKSGNTSNTEGKYVAKLLAARAQGKDIEWSSPETICYSMVSANPPEAISLDAFYVYDAATKTFAFSPDTKGFEDRDRAKGRGALEWAKGMYRDLFG